MNSPAFVDTHVHHFDFSLDRDIRWTWLEPDFLHPVIGNIDGIKGRRFTAPELIAESRFAGTTKTVHVQAALGTKDPVEETRWLQEMADEHGFPTAIVADASLQQPDVGQVLARHAEFLNVRGIRDFAKGDYLVDPDFERGYKMLAAHDMVYDLDCQWPDFHKARALAERHPDTILVLDHAGFPQERTDEYYSAWATALADLAGAANVVVKISGLGMRDHRWTVESIRPWVEHSIEAFGTKRTFFGTNWPLDRLFSSYTDAVASYRTIISQYTANEQVALLSGNAERVYRI